METAKVPLASSDAGQVKAIYAGKRRNGNERFANDGSYESVTALLQRLATRCFARASALSLSLEFEDVMQEMNLSYVLARRTWDAERGVLFATYLQTTCYRNFNYLVEKSMLERERLGLVSTETILGEGMEEESFEGNGEPMYENNGIDLQEVGRWIRAGVLVEGNLSAIESVSADLFCKLLNEDPAELAQRKMDITQRVGQLSPETRRIVTFFMDHAEQGHYIDKHGDKRRLTIKNVIGHLGFDKNQCTAFYRDYYGMD